MHSLYHAFTRISAMGLLKDNKLPVFCIAFDRDIGYNAVQPQISSRGCSHENNPRCTNI